MDWAFLPIFSKWTGLKFVEIWKKEKIEKLSFGFRGRKKTEMIVWNLKIDKKWVNGLGFFAYFQQMDWA